MVGFASLGGWFPSDKDKFHVIALAYLCTFCLTVLNGGTARTAAHTPEIDDEIPAWIFRTERADEVGGSLPLLHMLMNTKS